VIPRILGEHWREAIEPIPLDQHHMLKSRIDGWQPAVANIEVNLGFRVPSKISRQLALVSAASQRWLRYVPRSTAAAPARGNR
jgi:hypothetical protein